MTTLIEAIYCVACGNKLFQSAVICPKCGTPRAYPSNSLSSRNNQSKSKTTSVVLAIFFGFWTWIYTYSQDKVKFWVALGINAALGALSVLAFLVQLSIYGYSRTDSLQTALMFTSSTWTLPVAWFVGALTTIIAIVDSVRKTNNQLANNL